MYNAISAEWTKLLPHRGTWMLVWLYPLALLAILIIGIFVAAAGKTPDGAATAAGWINQTAIVWHVPTIAFGRYLIAAYFALVFAGEYGWNTWKLVVPHSARWKLIAAKYAVPALLLYLAWFAGAAITVAMNLLEAAVLGKALPGGITAAAILASHFSLLVEGIAPLLLTAVYASMAAVLTRSTLAAFIISLVLITLDQAFGKLAQLLSAYGMEWLSLPYRILPGYHLQNLASWLHEGVGYQARFAGGTIVAYSQTVSLLMLAAWIAGLAALTFATFRRQDIN
ncbi:MAG: hypothetical protein EOP60_11375 [Sphingomonadales bacterium]|nr:MAG: hypothetical protein EOP60_11375 [Sphingomonadales bacterium]